MDSNKAMKAFQIRNRLKLIETDQGYEPFRLILKHRQQVKAWLKDESGTIYSEYLEGIRAAFTKELEDNFINKAGVDLSPVIRGRIYMLRDLLMLPETIDSYEKIKQELIQLEAEGYTETKTNETLKNTVIPGKGAN